MNRLANLLLSPENLKKNPKPNQNHGGKVGICSNGSDFPPVTVCFSFADSRDLFVTYKFIFVLIQQKSHLQE